MEEGLVGLLLHVLTPPEQAGGPAAYQAGAAAAPVSCPARDPGAQPRWHADRRGLLSSGGSRRVTRTAEGVYGSLSPADSAGALFPGS